MFRKTSLRNFSIIARTCVALTHLTTLITAQNSYCLNILISIPTKKKKKKNTGYHPFISFNVSLKLRCSFFPSWIERFWNFPWGECRVALVCCGWDELSASQFKVRNVSSAHLSTSLAEQDLARLSDGEGLARKPCWLSADVGGSHQTPGLAALCTPIPLGSCFKMNAKPGENSQRLFACTIHDTHPYYGKANLSKM